MMNPEHIFTLENVLAAQTKAQRWLTFIMNIESEGAKTPRPRCSQVHGTKMLNIPHSSEVKES